MDNFNQDVEDWVESEAAAAAVEKLPICENLIDERGRILHPVLRSRGTAVATGWFVPFGVDAP